jgi:hypothetical protein
VVVVVGSCCTGRLVMSTKDDMRALHIHNKLLGLSLAYVFVCVATSTEIFAGQNVLFLYCICGCLLDCLFARKVIVANPCLAWVVIWQ